MTFPAHGDSRMYRMLLLSLLCVITYQVDGFVCPAPGRLIGSYTPSIQSSTPVSALNLDQHLAQEQRSTRDASKDDVPRKYYGWPTFPLLLWASLSTAVKSASADGNSVLFASTLANPASQPQFRWIIALGLIVLQSHGFALFKTIFTLLQQFPAFYMASLGAFPCITKSISAGIIGFSGDYMAQNLEYQLKFRSSRRSFITKENLCPETVFSYDSRRGMSIMMGGFFVSGPLMHWGYNLFEHILPVHGAFAALSHLVADMLILDSVFVATAFVNTGIMEGYDLRKHIIPQFQRDYADTLKASWATSIMLMPLGFLCFRFLPVTLRTVAMNITDVIWDAIVSFMTHRNRKREDRIGSGLAS